MRSEKFQAPAPKTNSTSQAADQPLPTFLDHVHELRRRLFWVVAAVLVASSAAYGVLNVIIDVLTRPLGDMRLFYLTPGGGLSFSFKLCTYVGIIVAVPVIMYHLYRFLEPLMGSTVRKSALFYVGLSSALAIGGVFFAYYVTLPAALHFLTGFNMDHIQAMLTADSYLSFVITYLLGAALLFQIPLLLLIINTMTPLKPSKLMKVQKFVIVGAFVLGAIISPTPDMMNQTFLALPIIGMYQLGVLMVWIQNRRRARKRSPVPVSTVVAEQNPAPRKQLIPAEVIAELSRPRPAAGFTAVQPKRRATPMQPAMAVRQPQQQLKVMQPPKQIVAPVKPMQQPQRVYSDIAPRRLQPAPRPIRQAAPMQRPVLAPRPAHISVPTRTVDGFGPYRVTAAT